MKPAKVGAAVSPAVASWQQPGANSQIPLPLRRGSSKSEKSQESDSVDADSTTKDRSCGRRSSSDKSSGKTSSILGSTSFCCASGQKDDNVSDTRVPAKPLKKKPPKNVAKKESERNGTDSPAVNVSKKSVAVQRGKNAKTENDPARDRSREKCRQATESPTTRHSQQYSSMLVPPSSRKPSLRTNGRAPDAKILGSDRHHVNDTGSETSSIVDNAELRRDPKYTDVLREFHKEPAESVANNLMSSTSGSNKLYNKVTNVGIRAKSEERDSVLEKTVNVSTVTDGVDAKINNTDEIACGSKTEAVMVKSCDTDDLDCPCCESSEPTTNELVVRSCDGDSKLVKPLDWLNCSITSSTNDESSKDIKIRELESEVKNLQTELQNERENLRTQKQRVLELEKEVKVIEQLKQDLIRESNLRKESEQRLLQVLGQDQVPGQSPTISNARDPAGGTLPESPKSDGDSSPLLLGYESRVRRYQAYIAKLEKDNVTLVTEIKKLKDLSPCSQGEQAKLLLAKLGQLERDNQQQQMEYESCLDDVANKLVHTLLRQKRLEEECQLLHLRVEQLELENADLLKRLSSVKERVGNFEEEREIRDPEYGECQDVSAVADCGRTSDERHSALTNRSELDGAECSTPVVSPEEQAKASSLSPNDKGSSASRIPAINASKPSPSRKRTKAEPSSLAGKPRNQRIPLFETTSGEESSSSPVSKVASPSKVSPTTGSSKSDIAKPQSTNQHLLDSTDNKLPGAKRKRSARYSSLAEKCSKDSKSHHVRWDTRIKRHTTLEKVSECYPCFPKTATVLPLPKLQGDDSQQVQEVWNCSLTVDSVPLADIVRSPKWNKGDKDLNVSSGTEKFYTESGNSIGENPSPSKELDSSVSVDGIHRTRDEGYSTMSSDQQQDSAADTTVSEHEEASATYLPTQSSSKFVSDDSVTECLDGSMTSSSDSGFGPLQQIALSRHMGQSEISSANRKISDSSASTTSGITSNDKNSGNHTTITSEKPSHAKAANRLSSGPFTQMDNERSVCAISYFADNVPCQTSVAHQSTTSSDIRNTHVQSFSSKNLYQESTHNICTSSESNPNSSPSKTKCTSLEPCSRECEKCKDQAVQDERVETAEKATLTEPEEALWREKALAHFIDESIWSLYSSESDTQMRFISTAPSREISPFDNVEIVASTANTAPKIVITPGNSSQSTSSKVANSNTEFVDSKAQSNIKQPATYSATTCLRSVDANSAERCDMYSCRTLERVASDSVLCMKEAVHELEDSLRPGLKMTRIFKTSTNIPLFSHFSASDIRNSNVSVPLPEPITSPEILLNLEKTMLQTNYAWPSSVNPSGSSSICSLQSSNSCHVISDETDDIDVMRHPSRKGSQDPDLNSASDAEYENLEHKDFVERWIQKEITQKTSPVQQHFLTQDVVEKPGFRNRASFEGKLLQSDAVATLSALKILSAKCASLANAHSCDEKAGADSGLKTSSGSPRAATDNLGNFANACSEELSSSSASSLVYPIIFTCENIEDDIEPSPNFNELEVDLELLDADVKEFNGEFYKLCSVGSSLSLDHVNPAVLGKIENNILDFHIKQYAHPPPPTRCKLPKKRISPVKSFPKEKETILEIPSKPTGYVKPIRPVTLTFSDVPNSLNCQFFSKPDNPKKADKEDVKPKLANSKPCSPAKSCADPPQATKIASSNSEIVSSSPGDLGASSAGAIRSYKPKSSLPVSQTREKNAVRSKDNALRSPSKSSPSKSSEKAEHVSPKKAVRQELPQNGRLPSPRKSRSGCGQSEQQGVVSKRHHWRKDRRSSRCSEAKEGCGTAWVHLQADPSLSDPKTRASFLNSMVETVSSSASSSDEEEEECDLMAVQSSSHLQRLCREKRQRIKACRGDDFLSPSPRHRASVINRHSLYYRFGEQEKAAMACFDFLEDITTSSSEPGSLEAFQKRLTPPNELDTNGSNARSGFTKERVNLLSPCASETNNSSECRSRTSSVSSRLRVPVLWNKPLSHNMSSSTINSQDYEILDHISLSDSCAESYSSTPESFEDAT